MLSEQGGASTTARAISFLYSRSHTIYAGSNEVQRNVIGEHVSSACPTSRSRPCRPRSHGRTSETPRRVGELGPSHDRGGHHMAEAYIINTVRTPVGRRNGGLSKVHPADLGTRSRRCSPARRRRSDRRRRRSVRLRRRASGPQAGDIARTAWLAAGLPGRSRASRSTASAADSRSRRSASRPSRSWPA